MNLISVQPRTARSRAPAATPSVTVTIAIPGALAILIREQARREGRTFREAIEHQLTTVQDLFITDELAAQIDAEFRSMGY